MIGPVTQDAGFRWTEDGATYMHYLGCRLRRAAPNPRQTVFSHQPADLLAAPRRVAIGGVAKDFRARLRFEGQVDQLEEFIAAGRRGASIEYFPSLAEPSRSYPCILIDSTDITTDSDLWWHPRFECEVTLRRLDGGSWASALVPALFYYRAGNPMPGLTFTRSGVATYLDELGVLQQAAANTARIDWSYGVPELLLEPGADNLVLQSEDFGTTWNSATASVTANNAVAPDGETTADRIDDASAVTTGGVLQSGITIPSDTLPYVYSVYVHKTDHSGDVAEFWATTGSKAGVVRFDPTTGEIVPATGTGAPTSYGVIDAGDYWRVYVSATNTSGATASVNNRPSVNNDVNSATPDVTLQGYITVWGAQFEQGTVPSSYIPTTTTSATRGAEYFAADFTAIPQALSVYQSVRVQTPNPGGLGNRWLWEAGDTDIGNVGGLGVFYADSLANTIAAKVRYGSGTSDFTQIAVTVAGGFVEGDLLETLFVYDPVGLTFTFYASVNGGATSSNTTALTSVPSAWSHDTITVGIDRSGGLAASGRYRTQKVLRGVQSMADARGA